MDINFDFLTPKEMEENKNIKTFETNNNGIETLQNNIDCYNNFVDLEKKLQVEQKNNDINDLFKIYDIIKLTDLENEQIINIIAIREISTKYGNTYICLDMKNDKKICVNNS